MGFVKEAKTQTLANDAKRAANEGRSVFVAQLRGPMRHSPDLSRVIPDAAEMIEAIESVGWRLDMFNGLPYNNNMTLVCLFRRS